MRMRFVIDLDGTICKLKRPNEVYSEVAPIEDVIDTIQKAHSRGDEIIIYTARGMRTYDGDVERITENVRPVIEKWLEENNVPYDSLIVGKPWAGYIGYYVDDRALTPQEFVRYTPSTLIVTLGGRSSRFSSLKYIREIDGRTMLENAVGSLDLRFFDNIIFAVVREHEERFNISKLIFERFSKASIFLLDDFTSSQSETVATVVRTLNITGQITIRDCDNRIQIGQIPKGNSVAGYELRYTDDPYQHINKSFILHKNGIISSIVEKNLAGFTISCGCYTFSEAQEFLRYYDSTRCTGEKYISVIIDAMLRDGRRFDYIQSPIFDDWGTEESLEKYLEGKE